MIKFKVIAKKKLFGTGQFDFILYRMVLLIELSEYYCQHEIDHVTQQPKETCQRTCRGSKRMVTKI